MKLSQLSPFFRSLLLLGLAFGQAELLGGTFRVSPVQLFMNQGDGSGLVMIFNEGDQPVRFQITASAWRQSETGEIQLTPTADILFFPKLLEVPPGAQRNVRVGSSVKAIGVEKTYRLFFDELPPAPAPGQGAAVNVITKMGIPIFITPRGASARVEAEGAISGGVLRAKVRNDGSSHATLQEVRVRGIDSAGAEVFSARKDGWYLLAESTRQFEFPIEQRCADLAKVIIEAVYTTPATPEAQTTAATLEPPAGACAE